MFLKYQKDSEFVYFVTDDTIDVGKEPLPEPMERVAICEEIETDLKAGKFNKKSI